ncbi:MAG TPA: proline--tRNA ligase [Nitrospiraceae bacterium]|nr:proline--tRNA ligase [Nitrospiraceae bacterium]
MRTSQLLIPTLREDPGEAEIVSHRLMLRAGMIRKVAAGVYTYLPLGLRVIRKIEQIVREEMNRAGAQELLMPIASPAELWRETKRWDYYGKELFRLKDRHEREFCLGPTHEEVITDLFRREVRSYRQLPLNFYQIQTKFRDEIRPRFGLMRGREFIMKDAYSFDVDQAGARLSYQKMYDAYNRIFSRCGLTFRPVEADTGLIGGSSSHEFMVLADTGEETVVYSDTGDYAANVERAEVARPTETDQSPLRPLTRVATPNRRTVEDVTAFLKIAPRQLVKTLLYTTGGGEDVAVLVRGDHEVNEIKVKRLLGVTELDLAGPEKVQALTGAPVGFAGPVGLKGVKILADQAVRHMRNFVIGANQADTHLVDANVDRDFSIDMVGDLRNAQAGDVSPHGGGTLKVAKGIEVGHVFMLGTKYSEAMSAMFLDAEGKERPAVMGCYGIGIGRTAAATIEQNHDAKGIIWPIPIAPFHVHLLPVSQSQQVVDLAGTLYRSLTEAGIEVLWDDRDERAGVKFNDADLIGAPLHLVLGDKGLAQGQVELKTRKTGQTARVAPDQVIAVIRERLASAS